MICATYPVLAHWCSACGHETEHHGPEGCWACKFVQGLDAVARRAIVIEPPVVEEIDLRWMCAECNEAGAGPMSMVAHGEAHWTDKTEEAAVRMRVILSPLDKE